MWLVLFIVLFGLLLGGIWIGAALGITALIIMHFWGGGINLVGSATFEAINMYSLLTLPGFIFMGQIVGDSGISGRIYDGTSPIMARFPGKLLQTNVVVCAMFAAVLGSSSANAAVVGSVAIPQLRKRGYDNRLVLGSVTVASTLGQMIPPSGALIIYGVLADQSIAALFAAGTIPGLIMALAFMSYIGIRGVLTPSIAPAEEKGLPFKETVLSLLGIWPLVVLIVVCIIPIYAGWCTPVEGAGIGSLGAIIIGSIFGKLNWPRIKESLVQATETSCMIFFLIIGAMLLAFSLSTLGAPRALVNWIGELPFSPTVIFLLICFMYIIMGCFFDGISMELVTLPFVVPVLSSLGFDLLWFGVILVLVIEIGLVTPPVGLNLYVIQGIAGPKTSLTDIFLGSLPFLVITLGALFLVTALPQLATIFPNAIGL